MDLEEVSKAGGMDDYESAPTTPLPVLGRGMPRQHRVVSPMTQTGGECQAETVDLNGSSTGNSEPPDSDTSSLNGNDASSSDGEASTPTAARTATRQLGEYMLGPGDGDEIREGRTRVQTRALNRKAAAGRISTIGPCEGGRIFHALLAA